MKKLFIYSFIVVVLTSVFAPVSFNNDGTTTIGIGIVNAKEEEEEKKEKPAIYDISGQAKLAAYEAVREAATTVARAWLWITSWILWVGGVFLNFIIDFSVVHMASKVDNISGIDTAWRVVRDLANIGFILVLIYTGIMTMIGKGDYKKTLVSIIIAALLINFSLFFTKAIIDGSNIIALQFFDQVTGGQCEGTGVLGSTGNTSANKWDGCISTRVFNSLGLESVYKPPENFAESVSVSGIVVQAFAGSTLFIVSGGVLLIASLMLVIRFIILILLMIISPLAFLGMVIPKLGSKTFWTSLLGQAFFAPFFLMFIWIAFKIIDTTGGVGALNIQSFDWSKGINGNIQAVASLLMNYAIVIGLFVSSIIFGKKLSAIGSSAGNNLIGWTQGKLSGGLKRAAGATARGTIGATARKLDEAASKTGWGDSRTGRFLRSYTTGAVAKQKWGTKKDAFQAKKDADKVDKEIRENIERRAFAKEDVLMKKRNDARVERDFAKKETLQTNNAYQTAKQEYEETQKNPMALPAEKQQALRKMREAKRDALRGSENFQKYRQESNEAQQGLAGAESYAQQKMEKAQKGSKTILPRLSKIRKEAAQNIKNQLRKDRDERYKDRQKQTKEGKELQKRLKELKETLKE